jgi:hypothetical protein
MYMNEYVYIYVYIYTYIYIHTGHIEAPEYNISMKETYSHPKGN